MKKVLMSLVGLSLAASPVLASEASARSVTRTVVHNDNHGKAVQTRTTYRTWHNGDRFDRRYAERYTTISNTKRYGLKNANRGYQWVRSGQYAVLINTRTNQVAQVVKVRF